MIRAKYKQNHVHSLTLNPFWHPVDFKPFLVPVNQIPLLWRIGPEDPTSRKFFHINSCHSCFSFYASATLYLCFPLFTYMLLLQMPSQLGVPLPSSLHQFLTHPLRFQLIPILHWFPQWGAHTWGGTQMMYWTVENTGTFMCM